MADQALPHGARATRFDLGRVVQRTMWSIRANWGVYVVSAFVFAGLPGAAMAWWEPFMDAGGGMELAGYLAIFFGYMVSYSLLQGLILKVALNSFSGEPTTLEVGMQAGVRFTLPLLGLSVLSLLGVLLGLLLIIVPGIILAIWWMVSGPILVEEPKGVLASLSRSRELSKGRRWPIFGVLLVYGLVMWVGIVLPDIIAPTAEGGKGRVPLLAVTALYETVFAIVTYVCSAALYFELLNEKEGLSTKNLASVFD